MKGWDGKQDNLMNNGEWIIDNGEGQGAVRISVTPVVQYIGDTCGKGKLIF
jgi:hypothetical protein